MEAIRLRSKLAKVILCERRRQREKDPSHLVPEVDSRLVPKIGGDGK